jgi:hypothetical protein
MTEEVKNESVTQTDVNSVQTENPTNDIKTSSAADDYKRDMFRYKEQAKKLQERLDNIELEKEQKKGNYSEVISRLKEDLKAAKTETAETRLQFAQGRLDDAIRREAMKKGVKGQALDVFLNMIDSDSKKIVEFDGDYNVNMEDVKTVVDSTMGRYSEVFSHKVNIADGTPNRVTQQYEKKVDVSKMTGDETFAYIRKLESQGKLK